MIEQMIEELKEKMVLEFEQEVAKILDLVSDATIEDFNMKTIEKTLCKKVFDEIAEKYKAKEPRWIPVEERLPEDDSSVLCYSELNNHGIKAHRTEISFYDQKEKLWYAENWRNCKVIAWMPLQEYEEGGAE